MTIGGRALFSLTITLVVGYMVVGGLDFSHRAALFPVSVGVVVFAMALLQLVGDLFPAATRLLPFLKQKGVSLQDSYAPSVETIKSDAAKAGSSDRKPDAAPDDRVVWLKVYGIIVCLLAFTLLMYHTQFLVAVPIFLVLFIWLAGRERLSSALWVSAGTLLVLFVLFKLILKVTF